MSRSIAAQQPAPGGNTLVSIPPIPALDLPLQGLHLIEASAGTGKTWTLSALMVRLIVEGQWLARQIIATTFTRAAAAELKLRIRSRFEQCRSLCHEALLHYDSTLQRVMAEQDWLAVYLLQKLNPDQLSHAKHRLQLALDSFDELFVGTLDSFCQKVLHEFAFDSGQHEILQITEQEAELCYQLIHDALRDWRSQQSPQFIELLVLSNQFKAVEDYQRNVNTVLNFLSAQLQPVQPPEFDWSRFSRLQQEVATCQLESLQPFLHADGEFHGQLIGKRAFTLHASVFEQLDTLLQGNLLHWLCQLDKNSPPAKWLQGFNKIDGHFKKQHQDLKLQFLAIPACQVLQRLAQAMEYLDQTLEQVQHYLHYHLGQTVRQKMPQLLGERGETTFSQQMRLLARALQLDAQTAQPGILARHIRHRYPVLLVDEFQDTNTDQDSVIEQVWRRPAEDMQTGRADGSQPMPLPCLILVGDPKQAIYGFRGGDMLTYQRAKQHLKQLGGQQHELSFNQRSVAPLVQAVDRLFGMQPDMGESVQYQQVHASGLKRDQLQEQSASNPATRLINHAPLRWLDITEAGQEFEQVGWQIIQLLQQSQRGQLGIKTAQSDAVQAINPSDIAVLCRSNHQLDNVQAILQQARVPVWRGSRQSIFQSALAEELVALLQVMLAPYHEGRLRRALAGSMLGKTLSELMQLDQNPDELASLQWQFLKLGERWHKYGFLAAWQQCSEQFAIWQQLSRQPDAERQVVNLRHLIQIVHQQSERIHGQHHLLAWLMRQISHPGQREWEMERRLSGEQGVQLMTIHKSKGLEFPIVFVAGLDKRRQSATPDIIFYAQDQQRMLTFSANDPAQLKAHQAREAAELRRLIYVALTRASLRLYVVAPLPLPENSRTASLQALTAKAPLYHWLPLDRSSWPDANTMLCAPLAACPDYYFEASDSCTMLGARNLPERQVIAWGLTSFSQLSRHQPHFHFKADASPITAADSVLHQDEPGGWEGAVAGEAGLAAALTRQDRPLGQPDASQSSNLVPLCFRFPRGTTSGDCLHLILEQLKPDQPESWPTLFERHLQHFSIHRQLQHQQQVPIRPEEMSAWFEHIVQAPLPDDACLASLNTRVPEFEFHLAIASGDMPVAAMHQLLQDFDVPVAPLNEVRCARYLHGFIDLVYMHQGRYYVADYKSNYLGDTLFDYAGHALKQNMSESGYWLQAVLYQVALHRFLANRLPDYQPSRHLGGAVYLYLRGMQAGSNQTGILHWQPKLELIEQMDALLGQHA